MAMVVERKKKTHGRISDWETDLAVQIVASDLWKVAHFSVELWPDQQHRFAAPRRWTFDLAWPELKVACEVEGAVYANGRHTRGSGFEKDCEKYNTAAALGWTVVRVSTGMVDDGRALEQLKKVLETRLSQLQ